MSAPTMSRAQWYADGLRWIGTLFSDAADHLERPSLEPSAGEPCPPTPVHEYLFDVRTRMLNRL
ncbi:MAG TPA: hypothetical protein VM073_05400 [Usitatibacter sp.]|nr:hypothetical protein [Usitatibacter sp.]